MEDIEEEEYSKILQTYLLQAWTGQPRMIGLSSNRFSCGWVVLRFYIDHSQEREICTEDNRRDLKEVECGRCNQRVKNEDNEVEECDSYVEWFHAGWEGVSDDFILVDSEPRETNTVLWLCRTCRAHAKRTYEENKEQQG
ncbi:hypothetical protein SK128_019744 [Halocaridina rubra]|uniref:Uncharacterized protein n=1 Tax=Halocaridina rubra TaxID=373956 RepID=A0AAN8X685_HALRR